MSNILGGSMAHHVQKEILALTDDEIIDKVIELRRMCGQTEWTREDLQTMLDSTREAADG